MWESAHKAYNLKWTQPLKLWEDYQLFIFEVFFEWACCSVCEQFACKPLKQRKHKVSARSLSMFVSFSVSPSSLPPFSGVQLQLLPCLPGAHAVRWRAELPAAASRRRQQPDLARRPRPEDSTHAHRQTPAAAWHRGHPGINMCTETELRQSGGVFTLHINALQMCCCVRESDYRWLTWIMWRVG